MGRGTLARESNASMPMNALSSDPAAQRIQAALAAQDWALLARTCRQALRKSGRHLGAHRMLGFAFNKLRQTDAALQAYKQAAALWPGDAELLINYANVLIEHARNHEALPLLEKVCELRPQQAMSWIKMAQCCYELTLNEKGFDAAQKAATLAVSVNEQVASLTQKAIHRRELGQVREAVHDCEAAIALCPYDTSNHTNRLLFMLADPAVTAAQLTRAALEYGAVAEAGQLHQLQDFSAHAGSPWKRLKIGFLSPDFRAHSVMYFVEGLLAQLDRRQFEVYAFFLYPKEDHVTDRVKRHADHFVRLAGLSAAEQVQHIRENGIDILIELAGHTGHNGLPIMAHKAAPVQLSWLGFPATTGLHAVDYKLTDDVTDPPDAHTQYSEQLYRLPTLFCCYRPMSRNPLWRYQPRYLVSPTPALERGFITFGSCNNLGKITDDVLALWGRVLAAVPHSRLLIEGKNLDKPDFVASYRQRCERLGLPLDRLDLIALDTANQYLTYHRIDIALDPFPLTGGTTSFDVLWMGVPLVSMQGESFKSRMGASILTYLGRTQWLAQNAQEYVEIASTLASDIAQLQTIRSGLRQEVEQSVLMREDAFRHHFTDALRTLWLQWMARRSHPEDTAQQMQAMTNWLADIPHEWETLPEPGVGIEPGRRVPLSQAHSLLTQLVEKAKNQSTPPGASGLIEPGRWAQVTELAETVLSAVPHDPVALACLAEVEYAHGHTDFAVTYLRYATEFLA